MSWKLPVILLILAGGSAGAQERQLEGVVLDRRDISVLSGVEVCAVPGADTVFTDEGGKFFLRIPARAASVKLRVAGYAPVEQAVPAGRTFTTVWMHPAGTKPLRVVPGAANGGPETILRFQDGMPVSVKAHLDETYEQVAENPFRKAVSSPFSAFTLNGDDASYCNIRRFLAIRQRPPKEAVRIEEMVNHLPYTYPFDSASAKPLQLSGELATCPWYAGHWLLRLAVQAASPPPDTLIPNNLVLLVDVSGSMEAPNKLPLLKKAFRELVDRLDSLDRISVVVYAGSVSVALPPTPGDRKDKILNVIDNLSANGSTAGQAGIELAFKLARENRIPGGNNRVLLATDGDFNVGHSSDDDMRQLISRYRDWGIYLTCIGVGMGNYKDSKLQTLAQWGQGNFVYLDNDQEAQRLFSPDEFRRVLVAFARDACIKTVFNPEVVASYRLIGYESRARGARDSVARELPGGEIGYGQPLAAFYELAPVPGAPAGPLGTVALCYETIADSMLHRQLTDLPVRVTDFERTEESFRVGAAVTLFGMLLQHSQYLHTGSYPMAQKMMRGSGEKRYKDERKAISRLIGKAAALDEAPDSLN